MMIRATVTIPLRSETQILMGGKWRNGYKRPNPERDKEVRRIRDRKRSQINKRKFKELKKTLCCSKCGENHPATLDFHHKGLDAKTENISVMVFNRTWKRVLAEIAKCEVLCANCHRKEHYVDG